MLQYLGGAIEREVSIIKTQRHNEGVNLMHSVKRNSEQIVCEGLHASGNCAALGVAGMAV